MRQDLTETTEDPGRFHRGTMQDLAFGLCAALFVILAIVALVVYVRKKRELLELRVESRPAPDVIDAEVVETTALVGPTHHVDERGRKVCSGCSGYSPEWFRPRDLALVNGIEAFVRQHRRVPPAWRIVDLLDEPQDVCGRCRVIEDQELAAEIEARHREYEETTANVMRRHMKWREGFRDSIREKAGGARRSWRSTADTF